jgi:hypothetical protein
MIRSFDFLFSCSLARPRLRPARCKDLKVAWDQRRSGEAPWLLRDRNFVKGPGPLPARYSAFCVWARDLVTEAVPFFQDQEPLASYRQSVRHGRCSIGP